MKKTFALALALLAAFFIASGCATPPAAPPPPASDPMPPDTSPPRINVSLRPQPFTPNGDGIDDEVTASIRVTSPSEITGWAFEIREPGPQPGLFFARGGEGEPPAQIVWDGLGASGELVQGESSYPFELTVANEYGEASYEGRIEVGVLAKPKAILKVVVPPIVFAPNSAEFQRGVAPEAAAQNILILDRIALILNHFDTYNVRIEGHANPTTPEGPRRDAEETRGLYRGDVGLQPLSFNRAQAVAGYLSRQGVAPGRLTPEGMGSSRPLADYDDKDNWWKNRRVVFVLEEPPPPQNDGEGGEDEGEDADADEEPE